MANQYNNKIVLSTGEVLIDLTGDDIKAEHVQNGIKFHDKTGEQKTGTNKKTVDASEVTTEAAEVLVGRPFGKGSAIEIGTMPDNSGQNITINSKDGVPIPRGFYDGASVAKLSEEDLQNLVPSNIKEGVRLFGGQLVGEFGADDISAQSKTVTPTFSDQQVLPDEGYAFLSSVTVKGMPINRTDNAAGGVTITIG